MKKLLTLIVLGMLLLSCQDQEEENLPLAQTCNVSSPENDLPWLVEKIDELETGSLSQYFYVTQTELEGETLFIIGNCCPNCFAIAPVYNCAGEELGAVGSAEGSGFPSELLLEGEVIWKAEDNACVFGE